MDQPGAPQPLEAKTIDHPINAPAAQAKTPSRWWRWPVGLGAAAAVYTGLVGAWLPGFIRPRVEAAATQALGTPVRLGELSLQPWTLTVAAGDVSLGPAASPWFTLKRAEAQLSLESLWRLAPVVSKVNLLSPRLLIERLSAERLNISPMLDHLRAQPASPSSGEPARFAVYNIALRDGELRYVDQVLQQSHRIEQLKLSLPFVSNLPSHVKVNVEPALSALVDGSPLLIEGRSLPFAQGRKSEVDVRLHQVVLKPLAEGAKPFLPPGWQVSVPEGELDTTLVLRFEARSAPAVASFTVSGGLNVRKLAVKASGLPGLGPLDAGWTTLAVTGIEASPLVQQVKVGSVALDGLRLALQPWASAAAPGKQDVAVPGQATAKAPDAPPGSAAGSPPWQWQLGELRLSAPVIDAQTEAAAPWPGIRDLTLYIKGLSASTQAAPATWQLAWQDSQGARFKADGDVQVAQASAHAQFQLDQLALLPWMAPVAKLPALRSLPLQLREGQLDLKASLAAKWAPAESLAITVSQGRLALNKLQARATQSTPQSASLDQVGWEALTLDGVQAAVGGKGLQSVSLDTVTLQGLDARLSRDAQGRVLGFGGAAGADALAATGSGTGPQAQARSKATPTPAGTSPTFAIGTLRCQACQLRLTDQTVSPAAELALKQTELSVQGLSQDLGKTLAVDFATRAQGPGQLSFKGQVRPQPLQVQAQIGVNKLDLRVLQAYIDPLVNVSLVAAQAQARGRLKLNDDPRLGLSARYQGDVGLNELRVLDRVNDADFLSWKALSLQGMDVAWQAKGPLDAALGRISLKDFYGRVIINPDGQLNLAGVVRQQAGGETQSVTTPRLPGEKSVAAAASAASAPPSGPAPAAASAPGSAPSAPPPRIRWDQVQLARGRVDFTDNFIKPNYSARLTQLEGELSAVSSAKPEPAAIKVAGAIDDGAPLLITGQIHPLGPRLFTEIEGSAKGIELTRLTPYASRYAGYAIEKGTLSVTVKYLVDGGKLQAENKIFLDQLTFGEKTNSPDATSLPVRFAVSLLKNSRGEIDINLPISGSLDEPEFSVGGIIWRVLVNLITKAVTAPFALLSGGGSEELGFVPFAPGSAELSDDTRQRLDTLATKLADRPALKLEATGRADPASDAEGLRNLHLDRLLRQAKAKSLKVDVAEVVVEPAERDTWLAAAYKAADIKKPRNLVGLAKTLPPAEMAALLKASAPADAEALRELANRRGDQVKAYLAARMPPERVLLTASKLGAEGLAQDKGPPSRVQFEVR